MLVISLDQPIPLTDRTTLDVVRYQAEIGHGDDHIEYVDREVDIQSIRLSLGFGAPSGNLLDLIGEALWDRLLPGLRPGGPTNPQIRVKGPVTVIVTTDGVDAFVDAAAFEFRPRMITVARCTMTLADGAWTVTPST